MKKVIEVSIGGYSFAIEDDAYYRLKNYLTRFESAILEKEEAKEVMEDVEARVAEIFRKEMKYPDQVVDLNLVEVVITLLGEIDQDIPTMGDSLNNFDQARNTKRFYRDPDDKKIAGVCSGIAAYFSIDVTLVRIIFLLSLLVYGFTFWLYIIIWIATKQALTVVQKLEMRGLPITADNIRRFNLIKK